MKRKMFLTVAAVAAVAVGARAQTQVILAPAGQAYTIANNASATAVNPVTYQWYRDGNLIPDATSANYTVPAMYAYGDNVQFFRMAKARECAGEAEKPSNTVIITFTGYIMPPDGCNLIIGGTCWADRNVDNQQTFATRPDMYTKFYQWNRLTAYSASDPLTPAMNATADESDVWTVNPCPSGWRLASPDEFQQLHNSGNTWVEANVRGNQIAGRFYGYNHTSCQLPNSMTGCVFFPASGRRLSDGSLGMQGTAGRSWMSTEYNSTNGYALNFNGTSSNPTYYVGKNLAFPIRCVR